MSRLLYIRGMIRPYTGGDKERLVDLLRLNIPAYFHRSEEPDFAMYLDNFATHYFVVEEMGSIIGAGGYNLMDDPSKARISWDIIHPDYQGKGIGKTLTLFRIAELKHSHNVNLITVRTTQLVYQFYEKLGFTLEKIEKDFWAAGFDLYQMNMTVSQTNNSGQPQK